MKFIRRLFTVSNIILGFALVLLMISVKDIINSTISRESLIKHSGVVAQKSFISEIKDRQYRDSSLTIIFKLESDEKEYSISLKAAAIKNLVNIGDSVEFITRPVTDKRGNFVTDGNTTWYSADPNELCQIFSKGYTKPIVSLGEYQSSLRKNAWAILILSLIFFGWYFFRLFGSSNRFTFSDGGREVVNTDKY